METDFKLEVTEHLTDEDWDRLCSISGLRAPEDRRFMDEILTYYRTFKPIECSNPSPTAMKRDLDSLKKELLQAKKRIERELSSPDIRLLMRSESSTGLEEAKIISQTTQGLAQIAALCDAVRNRISPRNPGRKTGILRDCLDRLNLYLIYKAEHPITKNKAKFAREFFQIADAALKSRARTSAAAIQENVKGWPDRDLDPQTAGYYLGLRQVEDEEAESQRIFTVSVLRARNVPDWPVYRALLVLRDGEYANTTYDLVDAIESTLLQHSVSPTADHLVEIARAVLVKLHPQQHLDDKAKVLIEQEVATAIGGNSSGAISISPSGLARNPA